MYNSPIRTTVQLDWLSLFLVVGCATVGCQLPGGSQPNSNHVEQLDVSDQPMPNCDDELSNLDTAGTTRLPPVDVTATTFGDVLTDQWFGIRSDYTEFYSAEGLAWLAAGFATGGLMANSGFDEHFVRHNYLDNIVNLSNDEFYEKLHEPKFFGDGRYAIPVFAVAAFAEPVIEGLPLGSETAEWGQRSLRTLLVGGPPVLTFQLVTGGSRPGETTAKSRWKPFRDNNGVSGHSFMGAVPFLSAAKMADNVWLKAGLYTASMLPAISRVNDDDHYFSQAFLGWWIAYIASTAVDRSLDRDANHRLFVYPHRDGVGVGVEIWR